MKLRLIVTSQAKADLQENFEWYDRRASGLGLAFLESVERKLITIAGSPRLFRERVGAYRLAATARFPYAIYFIWDEKNEVITVRRVLHFKQERGSQLNG